MRGFNIMSQHHFYGSNFAEWKTADNIHDVIKWFEKQKCSYNLWYVPMANEGATYNISNYVPQVEGAAYLGTYRGKNLV
jgi:hypothetical protein